MIEEEANGLTPPLQGPRIAAEERTPMSSNSSQFVFPALFISHGSPMTGLLEEPYVDALQNYWSSLPQQPSAIVIVSAHHGLEEPRVEISAVSRNRIVHDFYGFPKELYEIQWQPPGDEALARKISALLRACGFEVQLSDQPLDHGVWVPLRLMDADAKTPVVQVSLPHPARPEKILQLGYALSCLRKEGVLLVGSGGAVHNLRELVWSGKTGPAFPWAKAFEDWLVNSLESRDVSGISHFEEHAPEPQRAHPTREHFDPVLFTVGGSLPGDALRVLHREIQYGSLSMLCFALEQRPVEKQILSQTEQPQSPFGYH